MSDDSEFSGCGYEWDHTLEELDRDGDYATWLCRECGAELFDEPEE